MVLRVISRRLELDHVLFGLEANAKCVPEVQELFISRLFALLRLRRSLLFRLLLCVSAFAPTMDGTCCGTIGGTLAGIVISNFANYRTCCSAANEASAACALAPWPACAAACISA